VTAQTATEQDVRAVAARARAAAVELAPLSRADKDSALQAMADALGFKQNRLPFTLLAQRLPLALLLALTAAAAVAATDPRTVPTQLSPQWQARTRDLFKQAIEIPSVHHRGEVPRVAKLLADQFRAAGIPDSDIHFMPYEALPGDKTTALIVRWRSPHATKKPMLILGHMDVVEAKREDWTFDPFVFRDSPSDSQLGVAMALYAQQHGYKRAAMLFYTDIAAQTLIKPIITTFQKLGGTVSTTVNVAPGQTSYVPEVQKVLATKPDVIFTQTDAPTAAVLYRDLKQTNNLAIPLVGTDVTGASEYLKAVTFPVANAHLVSVYGTSVSGKASDEFTKQFNASFPGQQPLANANYAFDAVVSLALAQEAAKSSDGTKVAAEMKKVTNPPGTACFAFATCKKLVDAGTKINYEGASGSLDYNAFNNVFGSYGAFRASTKGIEQLVTIMSSAALAKATP